jgi:hypothetical protein
MPGSTMGGFETHRHECPGLGLGLSTLSCQRDKRPRQWRNHLFSPSWKST